MILPPVLQLVLFAAAYLAAGQLTLVVWGWLAPFPIPAEHRLPVRVLWWVFASLALGLGIMHLLDGAVRSLAPADRRPPPGSSGSWADLERRLRGGPR